jgi:serine acetyltransferase
MLRGAAAGVTGLAGVAALAACGETQVVTKEVPVETTVIKESRKSRSRRS